MTPEIAPRIVDDEPLCDARCPMMLVSFEDLPLGCGDIAEGQPCIPGLRRQRDAARRELCQDQRDRSGRGESLAVVAASRGWGYLYETPEGGEG